MSDDEATGKANADELPELRRRQWSKTAAQWAKLGPPLKPHAEDLEMLRRFVSDLVRLRREEEERPLEALLLGVTPEIANERWDQSLRLTAVDNSEEMIRHVWPGDTARRHAVRGEWLEVGDNYAVDLVMGDGCFNTLSYPDEYARLAKAIAGALRPGGVVAMRHFCQPEEVETVDHVHRDLVRHQIGNFHVLKLRLLMAMQGRDTRRGVCLGDVWDEFVRRIRFEDVAMWPFDQTSSIENYRGSRGVYTFPTTHEMLEAFPLDDFVLMGAHTGGYELADRCVHMFLKRK